MTRLRIHHYLTAAALPAARPGIGTFVTGAGPAQLAKVGYLAQDGQAVKGMSPAPPPRLR